MAIRVLVVDDSAFMRRVIGEAIASQPDLALAGTAINGLDALLKVEQLNPDVVTLDIEMPEMDGLAVLRHLMARYPRPVVMVSSLTQTGARATIRALTLGAIDFVAKPSGSISLDFHRVRDDLLQKIRIAATARNCAPSMTPEAQPPPPQSGAPAPTETSARPLEAPLRSGNGSSREHRASSRASSGFDRLVVIGSSTGGPRALGTVVPGLPNDGRTAYLIVQHMPAGFTRSLAERLDGQSSVTVREATAGDRLAPGLALVAPGDFHLRITPDGSIALDQSDRVHGVRPSVDVALESTARQFGGRTLTAILTGMGQDGATGAAAIRQAGGYILAEHESTCVVYGMPRAVVDRGLADRVVPLGDMAPAIASALGARHTLGAPA
ncbi:MAG: chemotaxis response regulator protein-glutamate methylesterase [Chloroflexota bacterium]